MNALINFNQNTQVSMNSQEIAELVQSRHDKVKQSIERLVSRGVIELPPVGEIKTATRPAAVYIFSGDKGKRDSLVVVAQLSPEFTGVIVDRWIELEKQASAPILPTNYLQALEQLVEKEKLLIAAQPKINHYDAVVERDNLLNATQVAQKLGMTAQMLNKRLDMIDVYSKSVKRGKVFKQWFVDKGFGKMRQTSNGYSQPLFTLRGEAWIVELLNKQA